MAASIRDELEALYDDDGKLLPAVVHDWAKAHPDSLLHKHLQWDDKIAGYKYRLGQIRQLIAVTITYDEGHRATVALRVERVDGGGYRQLDAVVKAPDLRGFMLSEARADAERFLRKYEHLRQYAGERGGRALDALREFVEEPGSSDAAAASAEREPETV